MGGPLLGFCGGRIDDVDGGNSLILGPSEEQEAIAPCQSLSPSLQRECNLVEGSPIGPTTAGLTYVNPDGPKGSEGDPLASAADVRWTFGFMGFNDEQPMDINYTVSCDFIMSRRRSNIGICEFWGWYILVPLLINGLYR